MLDPLDRLMLAPGVRLESGALVDDVRGECYPTNATAEALLSDIGVPLQAVAAQIAERWRVPEPDARRDVLRFAWELNGLALANLRHAHGAARRGRAWLVLALRLVPLARLPEPVVRRRALDTTTTTRAVVTTVTALGGRAARIACATTAALLLTGLLAGGAPVATAATIGGASGGALLLHELAHVVSLRGTAAALLLVGARTSVLHRALGRRQATRVSLAGPLVTGGVGVVLASIGLLADAPAVALAACPPAGHAFAATVIAGDGRSACGLGPTAATHAGGPR